jgi:hypothetical protein
MGYSQIDDAGDKYGNIIWTFENNGINKPVRRFTVKFHMRAPLRDVSGMEITRVEISGNWYPVVCLFCSYWPTTINFEDKAKGACATRRYSTDYIKVISDYPKAKMEITNYE